MPEEKLRNKSLLAIIDLFLEKLRLKEVTKAKNKSSFADYTIFSYKTMNK